MKILFLTHAFNSLTQRLFVELRELGHEVSVEFDINDRVAAEAVELFQPDLIIAPFLKRAIAKSIWSQYVCLIVHPGIRGDRGPSAIDWAILNKEKHWGVTVLQANAEMDGGDIWACVEFEMRETTKASLYHNEITQAAVDAVLQAVTKFDSGNYTPEALDYSRDTVKGCLRPALDQETRAIDWQNDNSETVLRKINCADGFPGLRDSLFDRPFFLYDAHSEKTLQGKAGDVIARSGNAICRATIDGAIWIGHLRDKLSTHPFKLPATTILTKEIAHLPEIEASIQSGYRDIWYEEDGHVGYIYFPFYNGAMATRQCERLRQIYIDAKQRPTKVIVLMGGDDFWSNGMNLNLIEASDSAPDESWHNINAIDDLAYEIITTDSHLTLSALQGNAGAGGVFLARAADRVVAHKGIVLNPHYKDMGNLYGSEYWTYLLPRYAGKNNAEHISQARLPVGWREAKRLGLIDSVIAGNAMLFAKGVKKYAEELATNAGFSRFLKNKNIRRTTDEKTKALQSYRQQELERMRLNFYGFDPSYHVARYNFVYKVAKSRTPLTIARHRRVNKKMLQAS